MAGLGIYLLKELLARSESVPVEGADGEEWIYTC